MKIFTIIILLGCGLAFSLNGQTNDPEALYDQMRTLSETGMTGEAIDLGYEILGEFPGYTDVQVYLALMHGRESQYGLGLSLLEPVLAMEPEHMDAHLAKCSLLFWSNSWEELLEATGAALEYDPLNHQLLYLKALASYKLGEMSEALQEVEQLLEEDPGNEKALSLRSDIYLQSDYPEIFGRYLYDHFQQPYLRRWHMVTLGGNYPISGGTISPSFSTGHFVDEASGFIATSAFQVNADAYLDITEKNYLLAGYGIGTGTYLPRHRAILHFWQVLPSGWAVSAGARYFYFDRHYLFYAIGAEKYLGDYWFELKNYVFNKEYGISVSSYLTARRYLANKYNYIALTAGYGTSPDEPYTSIAELQRLNALSIRLAVMRQLTGRLRISAGAGYQYEEFREMEYRHRFSFQAGVYYKINRN